MSSEAPGRSALARQLALAIVTPIVLLLLLGGILGRQVLQMAEDSEWVDHTDKVLVVANETVREILEQESGLRGYLVAPDPAYLEPLRRVRPLEELDRLEKLVGDNPKQHARVGAARHLYESWYALALPVLQGQDLALARAPAAREERRTVMVSARQLLRDLMDTEEELRRQRVAEADRSILATKRAFVGLIVAAAFVLALLSRRQLGSITHSFSSALESETRSRQAIETEAWIRAGQARLAESMQGDRTIEDLGAKALSVLVEYTKADVAAFFALRAGRWQRQAGYALDSRAAGPDSFAHDEGVVGRAATEKHVVHLQGLSAESLKVRSGTSEQAPSDLLVVPACAEGSTSAVLELGFVHPPDARTLELLSRIGENVALAVRSTEVKRQLRELLEEAQRQAEELQTQQEELRVSNEELEVQTTALRSTQKQLETQQAELEQTNDHLLQQREILEGKNNELAQTQSEIAAKAREVERASQFKSEFLSNMSHELRTPLNSSLILAKLLADNKDGNLTAEQVKFAETISAAGNDLLTLINDILDLSKIESGKMDVHPADVPLARLRATLLRTFEPLAGSKGLKLRVVLGSDLPASFETDGQRLEQILKNLVSNAVKFTHAGEVVVEVTRVEAGLSFAVRDTGIGIAPGQESIIFEAFRQADGTTNRKYGGTGLGLSISRELGRLLGGSISVRSVPGKGSTFTLVLPLAYAGPASDSTSSLEAMEQSPASLPVPVPVPVGSDTAPSAVSRRASAPPVAPGARSVLIIEDDEAFAAILNDVAREAGFETFLASTAHEGVRLAKKHVPTGIVLDMNLPDHTGLSVLDRLKREAVTRHIPVHVISASDYVETALSMGAANYLIKPVQREQLVDAIRAIEERSSDAPRRVLVVEDDATLRASVSKLLASAEVEIVTAATAEEALAQLKQRTFDCIVTDLGLPGKDGYELLETIASQEERYSVPPIIVYTGRTLTAEQEHRLRKYSSSIIVKGARSPDRLLDEVTLFLHQVESKLAPDQQRMLREARHRESIFEGRTVLVVEDDVRNVFALTSLLEPRGMRVVIARNGKEALTAVERESSIDLVLMDLMMPEMDGLEATRELRKDPRWSKLPIIALTAKAMRDDQEQCLAAGANDYVAKPFDVEMLLSLLRVWMPKR